jgi:archaemetzincin
MQVRYGRVCTIALALTVTSCVKAPDRAERLRSERLAEPFEGMKKHALPLGRPEPGDWLNRHHEAGQSLAEFVASHPPRPAPPHDTIEVIPIGDFRPAQERVLKSTAEYLGIFYGMKVHVLGGVPRGAIPDSAVRFRSDLGWEQISTRYVLQDLLPNRRTAGAFAVIALTAEDLYPDSSWNFVFGQASPSLRAGVWSIFRFGDPEASSDAYRRCLVRALKTASHEFGHMLSLRHCIAYECVMNGSNHLDELDHRPIEACPLCLSKLVWSTGADPFDRAQRLHHFFASNGVGEPRGGTPASGSIR